MWDVLRESGIFCDVPSESKCLFKVNVLAINVFVFPLLLTVRGAVHCSFRAKFGVASVFVLTARMENFGMFLGFFGNFFGVNLDYLDFFGDIFDL